jgi:hypothetical protein
MYHLKRIAYDYEVKEKKKKKPDNAATLSDQKKINFAIKRERRQACLTLPSVSKIYKVNLIYWVTN